MCDTLNVPAPISFIPISTALESLDSEGLQAPSHQRLEAIVDAALQATALFARAAVRPPLDSDIREFYMGFVVLCVNRAPGVDDALAD